MNIAFDSCAIETSKDRGIGRYTICQIEAMVESSPKDTFYYFNYFKEKHVGKYLKKHNNLIEIKIYTGKQEIFIRNEKYSDILGKIIETNIEKNNIDVFYITSPFDFDNQPNYEKKWFGDTLICATFYDLIPYLFKDHYLSDEGTQKRYIRKLEKLKWMDHLFAISQSAKDDLVEHTKFDQSKIDVILGAADETIKKIELSNDEKKKVLSKFRINKQFMICVAGDDERKNISGLIKAYGRLNESLKEKYQLVIVCKLSEHSVNRYSKEINDAKLKNKVILTNFVTDEELIILYNTAYLCVFVSKYEGLGLPVLEAYSCEVPVVTSDNSSLKEVSGSAAIMVDPFNIDSITSGIEKGLLLTDNERKERQKIANQIKSEFCWKKTAEKTLNGIKNLCPNKRKKKKIAFFTPLPPIKSGIADYSVDILNSIAEEFERIDVFVDSGYIPVCDLPSNVRVFEYTGFDCKLYDEIVYQMGNSTYHSYMLKYIKDFGGTVVLHDVNLHGLISTLDVWNGGSWERYRQDLLEDFSEIECDNIIAKEQNGITVEEVINGCVTNYASKIIVHSKWGKNLLLERNIEREVHYIPLYSKCDFIGNIDEKREQLDYKKNEILLGAFGIVHSSKRIKSLILACKKLWEENLKFKLLLVGELLDEELKRELDTLMNERKIKDNIKITGYVELDEFENYMDIVDIGINLRYPYNGENSASALRLLGKGKCILVNDIGSFSEIDNNACIKIPNIKDYSMEEEIHLIYKELKALIMNPEKIHKIGKNALKYAKNNTSIEIIKDMYLNTIYSDNNWCIKEKTLKDFIVNEYQHYEEEEKEEFCEIFTMLKQS